MYGWLGLWKAKQAKKAKPKRHQCEWYYISAVFIETCEEEGTHEVEGGRKYCKEHLGDKNAYGRKGLPQKIKEQRENEQMAQ